MGELYKNGFSFDFSDRSGCARDTLWVWWADNGGGVTAVSRASILRWNPIVAENMEKAINDGNSIVVRPLVY